MGHGCYFCSCFCVGFRAVLCVFLALPFKGRFRALYLYSAIFHSIIPGAFSDHKCKANILRIQSHFSSNFDFKPTMGANHEPALGGSSFVSQSAGFLSQSLASVVSPSSSPPRTFGISTMSFLSKVWTAIRTPSVRRYLSSRLKLT